MISFGLADRSVQEAVEPYLTREEAKEALRGVRQDEPDWRELLHVVGIELGGGFSLN